MADRREERPLLRVSVAGRKRGGDTRVGPGEGTPLWGMRDTHGGHPSLVVLERDCSHTQRE